MRLICITRYQRVNHRAASEIPDAASQFRRAVAGVMRFNSARVPRNEIGQTRGTSPRRVCTGIDTDDKSVPRREGASRWTTSAGNRPSSRAQPATTGRGENIHNPGLRRGCGAHRVSPRAGRTTELIKSPPHLISAATPAAVEDCPAPRRDGNYTVSGRAQSCSWLLLNRNSSGRPCTRG